MAEETFSDIHQLFKKYTSNTNVIYQHVN